MEDEFAKVMATFSELLAGMVGLEPAIIEQIRAQTAEDTASMSSAEAGPLEDRAILHTGSTAAYRTPSPVPAHSPASSVLRSPVTAREAISRDITPFATHQHDPSVESFGSVIHYGPDPAEDEAFRQRNASSLSLGSASVVSFASDAGSVIRHSAG